MLKTYRTSNSTVDFSKYEFYNKLLSGVILLRVTPGVTWTQSRERKRERSEIKFREAETERHLGFCFINDSICLTDTTVYVSSLYYMVTCMEVMTN